MMKVMRIFLVSAILWVFSQMTLNAQVWQWSTVVQNPARNKGTSKAYLWIPEKCKQVKGIVLAQHNMEEISILESKIFRDALTKMDFAEIWVSPYFDPFFNFEKGSGKTLDTILADLAKSSGYEELNFVPYLAIGHSAAASWPYYLAAWNPERTIAALSVSGQWPYFRGEPFAPNIWGNRTIDYIPALETMGEYEAAETWANEGLKERNEHPNMPLSMLACPAEGHFATSDEKTSFLAFYIKKAVQYRYPKNYNGKIPAKLQPIDPQKTGWLVERFRLNREPSAKAASISTFQGKKEDAFWFFDKQTAKAVEQYQARFRGQKPVLVGVEHNGATVAQQNTHQQLDLPFQPLQDGISFQLKPTFLDTVPAISPRLVDWTKMPAGAPINHPNDASSIKLEKIAGHFRQINQRTFQVSFERGYNHETAHDLWLAIKYPGNSTYKPAVQQAKIRIPAKNLEGISQEITFPEIEDILTSLKSFELKATSSANLPVQYYVESGPARIVGNRIFITAIPPKAKFPIAVTVIAWQYGRTHSPKVKSAESVSQTFYIHQK